LGVVVKIAHGWNPQATWYIARYILGVLGFEFRNPYKLRRQKAFIVPEVIPPDCASAWRHRAVGLVGPGHRSLGVRSGGVHAAPR
jgi:hypothetical protein